MPTPDLSLFFCLLAVAAVVAGVFVVAVKLRPLFYRWLDRNEPKQEFEPDALRQHYDTLPAWLDEVTGSGNPATPGGQP